MIFSLRSKSRAGALERQAAWQRSRAALSWTEKIHMAGQLRQAALALRGSAQRDTGHRAAASLASYATRKAGGKKKL